MVMVVEHIQFEMKRDVLCECVCVWGGGVWGIFFFTYVTLYKRCCLCCSHFKAGDKKDDVLDNVGIQDFTLLSVTFT